MIYVRVNFQLESKSVPQLPPSPFPSTGGDGQQLQLQLRELIEKYNKLQENFNLKVNV